MESISVHIHQKKVGDLFFEKEKNQYGFNYLVNDKPISLIMPYKNSTYLWKYKLHPIFDMNMPEGYLFEIFKQYLNKEYGYIDDFLLFSHTCSNIQSRLTFRSDIKKKHFEIFTIDEVLKNDTQDTFSKIVMTFLDKNAIGGVQPKSLALLKDKESLSTKEYIIKTWGDEYPELALNEYFCLKAIEKAGVTIPTVRLSQNNRFLLVERFNYNKKADLFLGFEEILALLGKNKEQKYSGSYELTAKTVYSVTTNKKKAMQDFFTVVVMNYLLKNGDAHLKNFGILYNEDFTDIFFAPAYDVVNTVAYFYKDKPALTMFGRKVWYGKKDLITFGIKYCYLTESESVELYDKCINALQESITDLEKHITSHKNFEKIGKRMLDLWKLSLDEKTYKEIPDEIIRNWSEN